jgi:tyrosine-protein kinase Etk/Wzc
MADTTAVEIVKKEDNKFKLSPKELILKYIIYLPLFILSVAISYTVAYFYLRYQVPYYNSGISLLIKDDRASRGGGAEALDEIVLVKPKMNLANEIELLKSATLMEKVVRDLNLNTQYAVEGNLKRTDSYINRFFRYESISQKDTNNSFTVVLKFNPAKKFQVEGLSSNWFNEGEIIHGSHGDFRIVDISSGAVNPEYKYIVQWQPPFQMAGGLAGGLNIRMLNNQASILRIDLITEIPQKGVDILNGLVKAYNDLTVENKNKVIDNTVRFIDGRLVLLTSELGKVEQGLQEFRQQNEIINIQAQGESQYAELKTTEEKLNEQEVRLRVIDMVNDYVSNPGKRYSLVPSSLGIEDATLQSLITGYNQLQFDREEKLKSMPAANPAVQLVESQLENTRMSILENLSNIRRPVLSVRSSLMREYNQLKSQVQAVPSKEREMLEIARQQGIKEKLYLFLLQKREESAITMAASTSNASAVDPAASSWMPVSPDRTGTFRSAIIFGLLIPAAFVYLKDLLNDKVTSKLDILKVTDMPIIGEIAHHQMEEREVVVGQKDRSVIAEQFRMARANLQYFITNKTNPVILVTSSMPGEGKTFTSLNLGAVWAVANKKTIILELDLRKPKITKTLGLSNKEGISNYIIGEVTKENLPVPVQNIPNLFVLPAGPVPPNPSEILLDKKIDELFTFLKANFDIIIIDSAPVGLVSDAKVLSRFVDSTVFIVRQRYTPKKRIEFIHDMYTNNAFPHTSLLVNDVKVTGLNSYYGYGNGYGHGYGYGYNYSMSYNYGYSENEKKSFGQKIRNFFGK